MAITRSEFVAPDHLEALAPLSVAGTSTLPTALHDLLETAIISGVLSPGDRLHADDIARHYGVSRIPVREALRSLHEAGWVEIRPRYGVRVRERTEIELRELFEVRAFVEAQVARWAAERRDQRDLAALHEAVDPDPIAGPGHSSAVLAASTRFYEALRAAAKNTILASTSSALEKRAKFYFSTVTGEPMEAWPRKMRLLVEAVESQEADTAASLASQYMVETGVIVHAGLFSTEAAAGRASK